MLFVKNVNKIKLNINFLLLFEIQNLFIKII